MFGDEKYPVGLIRARKMIARNHPFILASNRVALPIEHHPISKHATTSLRPHCSPGVHRELRELSRSLSYRSVFSKSIIEALRSWLCIK